MTIRRKFRVLVCLLCFSFVGSAFVYANRISRAVTVFYPVRFRFLISDERSVEVSTLTANAYGGAGYLLGEKGDYCVVNDCYLREEQAENVKTALEKKGVKTKIYTKEVEDLYLLSKAEKSKRKEILGTLQMLKNCIEILETFAKGAQNGEFTQERLKDGLLPTQLVLQRIAKKYEKDFSQLSKKCEEIAEQIARIRSEIVFAKELRYAKVSLCDGYICFCQQFSL